MRQKFRPIAAMLAAFVSSLLLWTSPAAAQRDSLILKNGDLIVGELKSLDAGVAVMETDYSKKDFNIEWDGVVKIYSGRRFAITLQKGDRVVGPIRSTGGDWVIIGDTAGGAGRTASIADIVLLRNVEDDFWSRLRANIDLGISVQKENNLKQFNSQSMLGYRVERWEATLNYNANFSSQDSVDDIERNDAGASLVYLLPLDWYIQAWATGLRNTEQELDLRLQLKFALGKYIVHTNRAYFRMGAGLSRMNEHYTIDSLDKSSVEGLVGVEVNLFDIGDLDLSTNLSAYPGVTERGRWRADFNFNLKYDLLKDFYVKFSTTINYDNRPAVVGSETYYIYGFSVGWELD